MKKTVISILLLVASCIAFTSCQKEQSAEEQRPDKGYILKVVATKDNSSMTKALALENAGTTIRPYWAEGETVDVYSGETLVGTLTAQSTGDTATLSGTVDGFSPVSGGTLILRYGSKNYAHQNGTIEGIASACDYAQASVTISSISGGVIAVNGDVRFVSSQSITRFDFNRPVKYVLITGEGLAGAPIAVEAVKQGDVWPSSIYVALHNTSSEKVTYTFWAADESGDANGYKGTKAAALEDGKYYRAEVALSAASATLVSGYDFNGIVKTLAAGGTAKSINDHDTFIKKITTRNNIQTSGTLVSAEGSIPIYASWDPASGTVTISCICSKIKTQSLAYLCMNMEGMTEFYTNSRWIASSCGTMAYAFKGCASLGSLYLADMQFTNLLTTMEEAFSGCTSITGFNLTDVNTSGVTDFIGTFKDCSSLTSLNISNFNVGKVQSTREMFMGCSKLKTLTFPSSATFPYATNMSYMFAGCSSLVNTKSFFSLASTNAVEDYSHIYEGCTSLTAASLYPGNATKNLSYAFSGCTSLTNTNSENGAVSLSIPIGTTNISYLFSGCTSISTAYVTISSKGINYWDYAFNSCTSLKSLYIGINNHNNTATTSNYTTAYVSNSLDSPGYGILWNVGQNVEGGCKIYYRNVALDGYKTFYEAFNASPAVNSYSSITWSEKS